MSYEVWEYDGRYIKGQKKHNKTIPLKIAKAVASKIDGYFKLTKGEKGSEVSYWVEDEDGMPIGLIEKIK